MLHARKLPFEQKTMWKIRMRVFYRRRKETLIIFSGEKGRMHIRKATKKDLKALVELSVQLMAEHERKFPTFEKLAKDFRAQQMKYFKNVISKRIGAFFVAIENGKIIGMILGKEEKNLPIFAETRIGQVVAFYVLPEFRGKGVGRKLFAEMKKWFRKKGFRTVGLNFISKNTKVKKLYKELGFRLYQEIWRQRI